MHQNQLSLVWYIFYSTWLFMWYLYLEKVETQTHKKNETHSISAHISQIIFGAASHHIWGLWWGAPLHRSTPHQVWFANYQSQHFLENVRNVWTPPSVARGKKHPERGIEKREVRHQIGCSWAQWLGFVLRKWKPQNIIMNGVRKGWFHRISLSPTRHCRLIVHIEED